MQALDAPTSRLITLLPGDVAVGERGDRLETLLGSCVAIVLTDPRRTLAAMCHIVHAGPARADCVPATAFADNALRAMREQLMARGIVPGLCEAYVYGGGNMFPTLYTGANVGDNNASWAMQALQAMGVRLLALDLGGSAYRKLSWQVGPEPPRITAVAV